MREPRADRLLCIRRRLGVSDCDVFEARRERISGDDMMTLLKAPSAQADRLLCIRRRLGVSDCDVFEARQVVLDPR